MEQMVDSINYELAGALAWAAKEFQKRELTQGKLNFVSLVRFC